MVLMGTDAVMGCSMKLHVERMGNKVLLCRIPSLVGNIWLIFTKGDLKGVTSIWARKLSLPIVPCASVSLQSLNETAKLVKQRGAWA
ncbi:hypothetical protein PVL29_026423 [Vitis rotundifolia]|uniref:Uncharacterized protein n=1 Tax=Vitis rotundifolia TaxID=103349 RepID=A0AA39D7N2_VITRO|nr:hypothetical protein PVL29_026423 [Vitis rotundifolia]